MDITSVFGTEVGGSSPSGGTTRKYMQITVFGANGKVGSKVVAGLLARGHSVKAFVHGTSTLEASTKLTVVQGDIRNAEDVRSAVKGSEVVVSALGSWGTKSKDILSAGMANIIPAMKAWNVKRVVSLTGADARDANDQSKILNTLSHFALSLFASKILQDGEKHIALLRSCGLNWSVLRSPMMRGNGKRGYQLTDKPIKPWETINRDDVAEAMIELALQTKVAKSAPYVTRA